MKPTEDRRPETACIHGSHDAFEHQCARALPIYPSAAYCCDSANQAAALD
jgi:O-acetylhomoserine/O-acetylserine sulfhydrylase-like pyridoxal-dependent enzyme